jgi:hypothetical protein
MNVFLRDLFVVQGKSRSSAISQLVSMNATQSVVKLVMQQQMKDVPLPDTFMLEIMWLLAQLAQRGNKKCQAKSNLISVVEVCTVHRKHKP